MKNRITLWCGAIMLGLLMLTDVAQAQFTELWKVSHGAWPLTLNSASRGAALNRSNGHYLVTNRDVPRIYVYNASTGALIDSLNMTGVSGGGGSVLQDIEVTSDGVVYATNLILNGLTEDFKIYRWANDSGTTVPTIAFSGKVNESARVGDAIDVAGTGAGTVIYAGGNNAATDTIPVFTTVDGVTFTNSGFRRVSANDAGMGIAQITPGGDFLTSRYTTGSPIRLYNTSGTRLDAVPTTVTPAFQADITYLEAAGRKWIASVESLATAGHNHKAVLLNATYGLSGAVKVGVTPTIGTAVNTTSIGADVELQYNAADSTMTVFLLVDNNGIAAYKSGNLLETNLNPFGGNIVRTQFVPRSGQNDTVFVDVQDDDFIPLDSVKLHYTVDGGAPTTVVMAKVSGDSANGKYRGIIPASVNTNGKRIAYYVTATDNKDAKFTSATSGYFAGITKMTLAGPRAIDTTTGAILWNGYAIRVQGVCTQEDSLIAIPTSRHDVVLQDDQGAMDFIEFAVSGVAPPWRMKRNRVYTAAGLIGQFNGKIQVAIPGAGQSIQVEDNGAGTSPAPAVVTIAGLRFNTQGEQLENALVKINNVRLTASSLPWPNAGAAGTNITITDNGVDSLTLRVPALSTANGVPPQRERFSVVGIAGQFDGSAPRTEGYQVIMRQADDIVYDVMVGMKDSTFAMINTEVIIPVNIQNVNGLGIMGYKFDAQFDSTALQFLGASNQNTISASYTFASNVLNAGSIRVVASGAAALKDSGAIFTVRFKVLKAGVNAVALTGSFNEGSPNAAVGSGVIVGTLPPPPVRQSVAVKNSKINVAITNVGHIGALNAYQDNVGFVYNAADRLYEGSLIMGNAKNRVPNAARFQAAPSWNPGFRHRANIKVDTVGTRIETETAFDDSMYANPLGIWVHQSTVLDTAVGKDGYVLFGYEIINKSSTAINGFRFGSFLDFDMTLAGDADRGAIIKDSTNSIPGVNSGNKFKFMVAYVNNGTNYSGIVPLTHSDFTGGRIAVGPNEVYSGRMVDSNKFNYISGFRATDPYGDGGSANDMSIFTSVGPYNIAPGDTAQAAFAMVVGQSLQELVNNARAAQVASVTMYGVNIQILTNVNNKPELLPVAYALDQNFPNPFNPSTTIRFALPNSAETRLVVYDMLGREVRTLIHNTMDVGFYETTWDGKNNAGAQMASGMYIYRIEAGTFVSVKKMMLLK